MKYYLKWEEKLFFMHQRTKFNVIFNIMFKPILLVIQKNIEYAIGEE